MAYIPQIEFYKQRQFGDKLNATFVFLRENAGPYLKVQLLIAGPILLILNIIINQFSFDFMSLGLNAGNTALDMDQFFDIFKLYGLVFISGLITSAVMPAVTYSYMKKYQEKDPQEITNSDVTPGLAGKIFNLIGFNLLTSLIVGAVLALFFLVIGISATGSFFLAFIFGMLFLVAIFYLFITLSLGHSIIIFENNNPIDAIGRCFRLITGKWWSTFGLIIVVAILAGIIGQLFGLPRIILFGVKAFTAVESGGDFSSVLEMSAGDQALNVIFSAIETFGSIITNSLIFIVVAFQYFNLVERRENKGLMSQIEGINDQQQEEDDEVF